MVQQTIPHVPRAATLNADVGDVLVNGLACDDVHCSLAGFLAAVGLMRDEHISPCGRPACVRGCDS